MEGAAESVTKFECSLCLEKFTDPRILTCFHSFCLKCLQKYISTLPKNDGPDSSFNCPLCRKVNVVPPEGVKGLQKNFYLDEPDESVKKKFPDCPDHPGEDLRFYCHVCKDPVCRDCRVINHESHRIEMLKDVVADMKERMEKTLSDTEVKINDNEKHHLTTIERNIDCLETTLGLMKACSAQMKTDIEETFNMVNSLIVPRLKGENDRKAQTQLCYDAKHKGVADLKKSVTEANERNDNNKSLFNLFNYIIENGAVIAMLTDFSIVSVQGTSSPEIVNLDVKKLSSFFFEFRDAVQNGLEQFKRNFDSCKITEGNKDVDMHVDERDKIAETTEVNLHNVEGNVKVKKVKTGSWFSEKSQNFQGQLKYCSPGYDNKGLKWKPGTVIFNKGDNFLRIEAEPDDPERPDFSVALQADNILDASIYLREFRLHIINVINTNWFHFKPDHPKDEKALKCLVEEINQFRMNTPIVISSRAPTSFQETNKTPNKPGQSTESPSLLKRKADTPTLSGEKKARFTADTACVGKAGKIPVIPLNRNTSLRRHSTASATITSEDQVSLGDDHDYLSHAAGAASSFQDQYTNYAACKQVPRTTLDSAKDTNVGQSSCSPSVGLVEQGSANSSVARNKFLNNNNGNVNDPVPSTSTDNQGQTTHSLLQDSDIQTACLRSDDQIPTVDCLDLDNNGTSVKDNKKSAEEHMQPILRCIQQLAHASVCKDKNCKTLGCLKMHRVLEHLKMCRKKPLSGCQICKQLIDICCYHAKKCNDEQCKMPLCRSIKLALRRRRLQKSVQNKTI